VNLINEIFPNISREEEFILCYARTAMTGPARARIDRLITERLDWNRIDELAARHRIRPLLYKHLKSDNRRPEIPAVIWKRIENHAIWTVARNLAQTNELARIVKLLRSENIPSLPFKGPVLGAQIYGNVGLREFFDLDLLVRREDLLRAKMLLLANGFTAPSSQNDNHEAGHIDAQLGCDFVNANGTVRLELHWSFIQKWLSYRVDLDGVWKRAAWVDLAGGPARTIAREDLLPYLCAHGAKHHWERLFWIVDIAEFVRAENDLDWASLLANADRDGNWRVVALGLYLAYGLLDASVSREVLAQISVPEIFELASAVGTWLFKEENRPATGDMQETRFYLKAKERVSDRLAYTSHLLKLTVAPSEKDRQFIKLPPPLNFLYPAIRPIRWLIKKRS
jgi:hypothetical protein